MDKQSNSTTVLSASSRLDDSEPRRKEISDLETPIFDAIRMASILTGLLERSLSSSATTAAKDTYYLTLDDRENILFAVYQLQDFAKVVNDVFQEVTQ